jgi:hypothetical protein
MTAHVALPPVFALSVTPLLELSSTPSRCHILCEARWGRKGNCCCFAVSQYARVILKLTEQHGLSERTIPTERSQLVGEVKPTFVDRVCHMVSVT